MGMPVFALPVAVVWRPLMVVDRGAVVALMTVVQATDGGSPLDVSAGFVPAGGEEVTGFVALGAFDEGGRLMACAAVRCGVVSDAYVATVVGLVHPRVRGCGVGRFLLGWSGEQARRLLAQCSDDRRRVVRLTTEGLTEGAERLYARFGLTQQFAEDVMRFDLAMPIPVVPQVPGVQLIRWSPMVAGRFYEAYWCSFRDRPGFPGWSAQMWIDWVAGDDDFRPGLSLLAEVGGVPVGFIVCARGWIVQVGVRPEGRGRGLGAALVVEALRGFREDGEGAVLLDVHVNNLGAARLYRRLGFQQIGRRARYEWIGV